ncbi:MAG TPA: hypothetical protein VK870_13255 [Ignavibacteriaceae bacterium]|nr:hypothetical protein [Ignavibacteriaceae bacterium]
MKFLKLFPLLILIIISCSKKPDDETELKHFPLNNIDGVITLSGVEFDSVISSDGNGSLKIITEAPTVIQLYETGNLDVEDATITYSAKVKTENVQGQVYLEMWCVFGESGEYFSRGLDRSIAGSNDFTTLETDFFLKSGENPDNIRLNIVIAGTGTVWIDAVRLVKR